MTPTARESPEATVKLSRGLAIGYNSLLAEVTEDIRRRDEIDSTRSDGPLICPEGAIIIDTSELDIVEVVDRMVRTVEDRLQEDVG